MHDEFCLCPDCMMEERSEAFIRWQERAPWNCECAHCQRLPENREILKQRVAKRKGKMKPNELVLTILQLAAPIFCFAIGLPTQGWFLVAWIAFFGAIELILKSKTGKTLSQWVWTKPLWQRVVLSLIMIAGMVALGYHFIFG